MNAWLIYDVDQVERNRACIDFYFDACARQGVSLTLYIAQRLQPVCTEKGFSVQTEGETLPLPDFAIYRAADLILHQHLEAMGIPTFNPASVSEVCNNKMRTYQLAVSLGVPVMETHYLAQKQTAPGMPYPVVVKPLCGHGGAGVALAKNDAEFTAATDAAGYPCLVQKETSQPGRDVRVYVLGHSIRKAMLRSSDTDFRANFCLGGTAKEYNLSAEERQMVQKLADALDFGFAGIDFVFHDGHLVFNEIEDVVGARMLYSCTDIQIVEEYLGWILARLQGKTQEK